MALTIIADGCIIDKGGAIERRSRDAWHQQGVCEQEPHAREMSRTLANQWVSVRDKLPVTAETILYLEYPANHPASAVRLGRYEHSKKAYLEHGTGKLAPQQRVIAWMPVPQLPDTVYRHHQRLQ